MKNTVTTIVDIDALVAETTTPQGRGAESTSDSVVVRITLEWELDAGGGVSTTQHDGQDGGPERSEGDEGDEANSTNWRDTIAQFPDD